MQTLVACVITGIVCLGVGTVWGRKLEQKAVGRVMFDFQRADTAARSFVAKLQSSLPWLEKHLHL